MAVDHHVPRLKRILRSNQIAVFENNSARRVQLRARFKRDTRVEILHGLDPGARYELVVIATPPRFHLQYFTELLGVADEFLIEKPMTIDFNEAKQLELIAKSANKKVYVNLIRRTLKSYSLIRGIVASGLFGALKQVNVFEGSVFTWKAVSAGSFSRELNGGGVLMDTGPHTLDLMFQVFDELDFRSCRVDGRAPAIEANCQLSVVAEGDVPVDISLSRNRYLSNTTTFEFENAEIEVGVAGETVAVKGSSAGSFQMLGKAVESNPTWPTLVDNFYRDFLLNRENTDVSPTESLKIARLIDEAYRSADFIEAAF